MTISLQLTMSAQGGVFTRAQAIAAGLSADEVRQSLDQRRWVRVRRGTYTTSVIWDAANWRERHVLGLRAVVAKAAPPVVGSHETAAAVLEIDLWEPSYDSIHLTRPDHSARQEAGVRHHAATLPTDEVVSASGLLVTSALRTGVDIARHVDFEHGVVAVDSALRLARTPVEDLRAIHLRCADWPGARDAGRAVAFADPRSGSVGESRTRVQLAAIGAPEPETQVCIYDERGWLVGIADFLVLGKIVLEFDGRVKYGLDGLAPEALAARLAKEKAREDALRRLGYEVVRIVWADLYHPGRIAALVRAAMARAEATPPVRGVHSLTPLTSNRSA